LINSQWSYEPKKITTIIEVLNEISRMKQQELNMQTKSMPPFKSQDTESKNNEALTKILTSMEKRKQKILKLDREICLIFNTPLSDYKHEKKSKTNPKERDDYFEIVKNEDS